MNYKEIQNDVIRKYNIDMCDGTKCADDWSRTHAHWKLRRVCKWKQANSIQSTFTLLHEIGHIENHVAGDRRAESEYHATIWAMEEAKKYNLEVPEKIIDEYQRYVDMERRRGERRGGSGYGNLDLRKAVKPEEPPKVVEKIPDAVQTCVVDPVVVKYCVARFDKGWIHRRLDNRRFTDKQQALERMRWCAKHEFRFPDSIVHYAVMKNTGKGWVMGWEN